MNNQIIYFKKFKEKWKFVMYKKYKIELLFLKIVNLYMILKKNLIVAILIKYIKYPIRLL